MGNGSQECRDDHIGSTGAAGEEAKTHLEDDCSPIFDDSFSPPATLRQRISFELELQQHLAKSRKSPGEDLID